MSQNEATRLNKDIKAVEKKIETPALPAIYFLGFLLGFLFFVVEGPRPPKPKFEITSG